MLAPRADSVAESKSALTHDLTLSIVLATKREVERQGARFYLMIVPDKGLAERNKCCAEDTLSREVAAFARRNGIAYVDLAAAFSAIPDQAALYYRRDIHFSPAGNRLVAITLARAMGLRAP
jgi:SGNH hydrolase-like domain, acetyltransferase AlgX